MRFFLHKLALTFFLQDKAIDPERITKQINYCCLLDTEELSLLFHLVIYEGSPGSLSQVKAVLLFGSYLVLYSGNYIFRRAFPTRVFCFTAGVLGVSCCRLPQQFVHLTRSLFEVVLSKSWDKCSNFNRILILGQIFSFSVLFSLHKCVRKPFGQSQV